MRLGEGMDKCALVLCVHGALHIPANYKPDRASASLKAGLDAELNEIVFRFVRGVVGDFQQPSTHGRFAQGDDDIAWGDRNLTHHGTHKLAHLLVAERGPGAAVCAGSGQECLREHRIVARMAQRIEQRQGLA